MLRFLHVMLLNAWRGMRRANGTPALIVTLVAVCVLFIGSNASARASLQTAMHIVGLPVAIPVGAADMSDAAGGTSGIDTHNSGSKSSKKDETHSYSSEASNKNKNGSNAASNASAQSLTGSVSLNPSSIVPICSQNVQLYDVQYAILSFDQSPNNSVRVNWKWETRIDSGSNSGQSPLSSSNHTASVGADTQIYALNPSDPAQPLLSAASNPNYAYSFRLDVDSPFTANSPWVSVPQADSSTCS